VKLTVEGQMTKQGDSDHPTGSKDPLIEWMEKARAGDLLSGGRLRRFLRRRRDHGESENVIEGCGAAVRVDQIDRPRQALRAIPPRRLAALRAR
jgi:hypothetical protein